MTGEQQPPGRNRAGEAGRLHEAADGNGRLGIQVIGQPTPAQNRMLRSAKGTANVPYCRA